MSFDEISILHFEGQKKLDEKIEQKSTISFSTPLHDATLHIYNMYSQLMQQKSHLSGREIIISRENLGSGIYIYEVTESGRKISTGKAVIY